MAKVLIVHIKPPGGGRASVGHMFYGETEAECRENFAAHAKGCRFLGPAIAEGRIDEALERLDPDEWPEFDAAGGPIIDVEPVEGPPDDEDDEDENADEEEERDE